MCGIVGYVGHRNVSEVVIEGLARLEYRGYDSAGIAVRDESGIKVVRKVGKVADLVEALQHETLKGTVGMGHTRWATHGGVTEANAHPHKDESNKVVLIHNGIVENYLDIRQDLIDQGVSFNSETDTEVIAQLLARIYSGDPKKALLELYGRLRGSFALVVIFDEDPEHVYCIRKGSPLIVAFGDGENFCASDVPAILKYTRKVAYLDEGEMACLSRDSVLFWDRSGKEIIKEITLIDWDESMVDKGGYPHFMLKEINEQGAVLRKTLENRIKNNRVDLSSELDWSPEVVQKWNKIHIIACGTSYYAALVAERFIERFSDLDIRVDIASEYRYRKINISEDTLAVFVSQSGETIDTLAAERFASASGARCMAITNNGLSTIAREVHDVLMLKAGPEIGVAATKTFTGQMAVLVLLGLYLAKLRGGLQQEDEVRLVRELNALPFKMEKVLAKGEEIKKVADRYSDASNFLFLGRGFSCPIAMEGALKLKEISYIHAEAYAAGEMKHGPIALLDKDLPVVVIMPEDSLYEKTLSNVQETKARKAPVISVSTEGNQSIKGQVNDSIEIPGTSEELTPFLTVIPLQLFAYYIALAKGKEIDQPRNLAKSVTVE